MKFLSRLFKKFFSPKPIAEPILVPSVEKTSSKTESEIIKETEHRINSIFDNVYFDLGLKYINDWEFHYDDHIKSTVITHRIKKYTLSYFSGKKDYVDIVNPPLNVFEFDSSQRSILMLKITEMIEMRNKLSFSKNVENDLDALEHILNRHKKRK